MSAKWWREWFPHRSFVYANHCGYLCILHAPKHISRWFGRGEIGLEWRRRSSSAPEYELANGRSR